VPGGISHVYQRHGPKLLRRSGLVEGTRLCPEISFSGDRHVRGRRVASKFGYFDG
jgi:hypothetical protein